MAATRAELGASYSAYIRVLRLPGGQSIFKMRLSLRRPTAARRDHLELTFAQQSTGATDLISAIMVNARGG